MIRAFVFDFGGVLVQGAHAQWYYNLAERLGLPIQRWVETLYGTAWRGTYADYISCFRWIVPALEVITRVCYGTRWLHGEVVDIVEQLGAHYRIGLLSNASSRLERWLVDPLGIRHLFDAVVISAIEGVAKPDPLAFELALQRLGVAPDETLFVDDLTRNTAAAASLGMDTITFTTPLDLRCQIERRGLL